MPLLSFLFLDLDKRGFDAEKSRITLSKWPAVGQADAEALCIQKCQLIAQCKDLLQITTSACEPELLSEKVGPMH